MLSDCHRRIERFLAVLVKIAREKKGAALDDREREALQSALEYFRLSGPRHTADEEESLFPRMRSCADAAEALASIDALHADHLIADKAHAEVDDLASRWLQEGGISSAQAGRLAVLLESLALLYARHITVEDKELFPTAAKMLGRGDIEAIGEEMARRRGLQ
jgi:hemerythrin-like domain-containing protein